MCIRDRLCALSLCGCGAPAARSTSSPTPTGIVLTVPPSSVPVQTASATQAAVQTSAPTQSAKEMCIRDSYNAIHLRHTAWRLCVRHGAAPAPITACIWSTAYSPWIWPRSGRWRAWIFAGKMCIRDRPFTKLAEDTLIPDIVSLVNINGDCQFIIFDAKYYNCLLYTSW